jgi:hypothetical protein
MDFRKERGIMFGKSLSIRAGLSGAIATSLAYLSHYILGWPGKAEIFPLVIISLGIIVIIFFPKQVQNRGGIKKV